MTTKALSGMGVCNWVPISIRNEIGDVLWARQVSTQPEKIQAFFQQLTQDRLQAGEEFVAILEVCGFNDWLIRMLHEYRCHKDPDSIR